MKFSFCLLWFSSVLSVAIQKGSDHGMTKELAGLEVSVSQESIAHETTKPLHVGHDKSRRARHVEQSDAFAVKTPATDPTTTGVGQSLAGSIMTQVRHVEISYKCPNSGEAVREFEFVAYVYVDFDNVHLIGLVNIGDFLEKFKHKNRFSTTFGGKFQHIFCPNAGKQFFTGPLCTYVITGTVEGRYSLARGWMTLNLVHEDPIGMFNPWVTETCNPNTRHYQSCPAQDNEHTTQCQILDIKIQTPSGASQRSKPPRPPKYFGPPAAKKGGPPKHHGPPHVVVS
ncbi:protein of unknown function [Taphrina deformans PYCC 5710]|uniref:Uncharacterized protein n=1 Tax=Taphrina deformans (strain PYCC 5710 / ATCC 11124 / CBS 356.35 / IMI 108563 / JCM 9778 / NBRC 8474) TaxID=1097556 RepID=R4XG76_TAPDE|nr:protein of unknown function [Taphrina deformans PYCC 5710]|eukprot:CCG84901.1 protein of unknown function [Taphrina deformans PYCC 5710]